MKLTNCFGLRAILECDIVGYALARVTDDDLEKSQLILKEFDELLKPGADMHAWGALNWKFHRSIYLPSGRKRTLGLIPSVAYQLRPISSYTNPVGCRLLQGGRRAS